jgi:formylmethanofuran dehydrogenase subunit A
LHVSPEFDPAIERHLARWFDEHSTLEFANFAVGDEYLPE